MNDKSLDRALSRRQLMGLAAGGLATGLLPLKGWADDEGKSSSNTTLALASSGPVGKRVVVVGGGMAGMTAAKYLRLWGGTGVQVTLVEPDALYTSSIMSNLVLNGSRNIASLQFKRDALAAKYGVQFESGSVTAVNAASQTVSLTGGRALSYDRLVLAPGVSFDDAYGLTQADYDTRTPHAWRAGAQTTLLRNQIAAMRNGDVFVMTIPKSPYRCPPGPYERACVVADYLKKAKGPSCKVIVLDENLSIQAERHTFELAFSQIHAGIIQYVPGVTNIQVDAATKVVSYVDQLGALPGRAGEGGQSDRSTPRRGQCHRGLAGAGRPEQWHWRTLGHGQRAELRVHRARRCRHPRDRRRVELRPAQGRACGQPGSQDLCGCDPEAIG